MKFGWLLTLSMCVQHIKLTQSWTLSSLNITNYSIINVSVFYSRAFLCLKYKESDSNVTESGPILVESTWPENIIGIKPKIFPSLKIHRKRQGTCRQIIQGVGTDIDSKGRLWLIDNGSSICHPKLIIYDLLYLNEEVQFQTFNNIKEKTFNSILVDPVLADDDSRAYISLIDEEFLFVYSFNERKIGKLKFMSNQIFPSKPISFSEMAIAQHDTMYIADAYSGNLFSLNLTPIRHLNFSLIEKKKISIKSPLTYIGMLLGSPTALSIHPKGYLFYTLSKDCAVVMWDSRTPLTAEWHEIIYQKCSTLTQLLFGQKGSVYAVSKDIISSNGVIDKHCLRIYNHK